jgi:thiamine biosynthesis protein ThiI
MKFGASHRVKFVTVPFEVLADELAAKLEPSQRGVILKRMMLRAATRIASRLQIEALVTGESVAQVASQTLANLAVIDAVTDIVLLRPLIVTDKQDIIDIARRIGTEEFSKHMPEYCGAIAQRPTTRASPLPEEAGHPVLCIPFYELRLRFPALAQGRQYLLYCDKGVMSRLHVAYLREAGHTSVGVFCR